MAEFPDFSELPLTLGICRAMARAKPLLCAGTLLLNMKCDYAPAIQIFCERDKRQTVRQGNNPKRRLMRNVRAEELDNLAQRVRYKGSAHHKLRAADYPELEPQSNPRRGKTPCDKMRPLNYAEACDIFMRGIRKGWVSEFQSGGVPKYIWGKDKNGVLYRAQTQANHEIAYHGFPLLEKEQAEEIRINPELGENEGRRDVI